MGRDILTNVFIAFVCWSEVLMGLVCLLLVYSTQMWTADHKHYCIVISALLNVANVQNC